MPVRKYRSVDQMPKPPARTPLDPENLALVFSVSGLCYWLSPWSFPPGVYKHGSIEESNGLRERWEAEAFRARER